MKKYTPRAYWEKRLSQNFSLGGVGYLGLGVEYNKWLYKSKIRTLETVLMKYKIKPVGKSILDIGIGVGFYVDYWLKKDVSSITGIDITTKSIEELRKKYPKFIFIKADISSKELTVKRKFDIITVFDVLFHIVDEGDFERAIKNIAEFSRKGTKILIIDNFLQQFSETGFHQKSRTKEEYRNVFSKNGIKIIDIVPIFYFMNNPTDKQSIKNRFLKIIISIAWFLNSRMIRVFNRVGFIGKPINFIIGAFLYFLDGIILRYVKNSPSSKLMLAEKL